MITHTCPNTKTFHNQKIESLILMKPSYTTTAVFCIFHPHWQLTLHTTLASHIFPVKRSMALGITLTYCFLFVTNYFINYLVRKERGDNELKNQFQLPAHKITGFHGGFYPIPHLPTFVGCSVSTHLS